MDFTDQTKIKQDWYGNGKRSIHSPSQGEVISCIQGPYRKSWRQGWKHGYSAGLRAVQEVGRGTSPAVASLVQRLTALGWAEKGSWAVGRVGEGPGGESGQGQRETVAPSKP